jgi:hypothetical protein
VSPKRAVTHVRKAVALSDYNLDPEDEINNYTEERRILSHWLVLGNVSHSVFN